jgi:hypothetical protein
MFQKEEKWSDIKGTMDEGRLYIGFNWGSRPKIVINGNQVIFNLSVMNISQYGRGFLR